MERISATNDLAFKKVLSSEANKDILKGFLKDFFNIETEDIVMDNPYSIKTYKEYINGIAQNTLRETITDIKGNLIDLNITVELQLKKTKHYIKRAIYYTSDTYCGSYNEQNEKTDKTSFNKYSTLRGVYSLSILGENYFNNDNDAFRLFEQYDRKHNEILEGNYLRMAFFELKKSNVGTENQKHWKEYFLTGKTEEGAPEYIKKASEIINFINLSKEEKGMVTALEKAKDTYEAIIADSYDDGKLEGKLEGKIEGKLEGKLEIAKRLIIQGWAIEKVTELTGLSLKEIKSLN